MSQQPFFPASFEDDGSFFNERVDKLASNLISSHTGALLISLLIIIIIDSRGQLSLGSGVYYLLIVYSIPLSISLHHLKKSEDLKKPGLTLNLLYGLIAATSGIWSITGALLLPVLDTSTLMIAVSMFLAVAVLHTLPFVIFPKQAFFLFCLNMLPLSIAIMIIKDSEAFPIGLSGLSFMIISAGVIASYYNFDMESFQRRKGSPSHLTEPNMSVELLKQLQVERLHSQSSQSIILQLSVAYFICYNLVNAENIVLPWCWFLSLLSIQSLRFAEFFSFQNNPDRFSMNTWRLLFGIGLIASHLVWISLLFLFQDMLPSFGLGAVFSAFIMIAFVSSMGLAADKTILYMNCVICLIPISYIYIDSGGGWTVVSFGAMIITSVIVVLENMHRSSVDSIRGFLLQKVNEFRANKMASLNTELTEARENLIQVNASLESQIQERTQELKYQATHDMLTGLGNRYYFSNIVAKSLEKMNDEKNGFSVYLLDLDRFKEINDGMGHMAGDKVLIEIAKRIQEACTEDIVCARWGGDEFVILHHTSTDVESVTSFAQELAYKISQPIALQQANLSVGASIGIAICPQHGLTAERLLEHADIAVYRAKCDKSSVSIYIDEWGLEAAQRLQLSQKLNQSIEDNDIDITLQPLVCSSSGEVVGFEALARWRDENGKNICPPNIFIGIAEESGLVYQLGKLVLFKACKALMSFAPNSNIRVAVNVSVHQLASSRFISDLENILEETTLAPNRLELEMTETVFAGNVEAIRQKLIVLRQMGIRISIDDFGTGYSSISYLRNFPLDVLKIDRSFVNDLSSGGKEIYSSIISLAKGLGLSVVVEGIETEKQLKLIQQLGGDELQGYLFSEPIDISEISPWFDEYLRQPVELDNPIKYVSSK